jgi:hypothetical protein
MSAARLYAWVTGLLLVVAGVAGFLWTEFSGWAAASTDAVVLGVQLNPSQNLVHTALGTLLLLAATAAPPTGPRLVAVSLLLLLLLGIAGFLVVDRPDVNVLALNDGANALHLALGLLGAVLLPIGRARAAGSTPPR